ncbi:MAG: T9SS type A sorting domain-containing protein [Bacteroidetes bacterium]|nr:T9SS type A sorting domain-containing protein [Bacteroidota bacterium]
MDSVGNAITNNSIKGNLNESIQGIEFDSSNDLYILGTTNSNFMEFDNLNTNPTGASNIYLAKLSKTPTFIQGIEKASFKIYPNPAIDKIFIESYSGEEIKIDLFNIFYQKIYSSTNKRSIFTIDCSSFNSGLYFFKITAKNKMYQQKIIIQH